MPVRRLCMKTICIHFASATGGQERGEYWRWRRSRSSHPRKQLRLCFVAKKKKRIGCVTTYCISFLQEEERKAQLAPNKQFIIRRPIWPHVEVTRQAVPGWVISVWIRGEFFSGWEIHTPRSRSFPLKMRKAFSSQKNILRILILIYVRGSFKK